MVGERERGYSLGYFLEDGNFGSEWGSGALKRRLTSAGSEEERGSGGEDGGGDNSVPLRRLAHRSLVIVTAEERPRRI